MPIRVCVYAYTHMYFTISEIAPCHVLGQWMGLQAGLVEGLASTVVGTEAREQKGPSSTGDGYRTRPELVVFLHPSP